MAWTVYRIPAAKRGEIDTALRDDLVSRQSHTVRDSASAGGPPGLLYVMVEGSGEAVARAEGLLGPLGEKIPGAEGEAVHRKFKDEEEAASSGMGLFFTE